MNWQEQLRDADPAADGGLPAGDVESIRRAVVAAAGEPGIVRTAWPRPIALAAIVILMIASGVAGGRRLPPSARPASIAPAAGEASALNARRQLQFATPGGTRIIWVFDPEFGLKETMP